MSLRNLNHMKNFNVCTLMGTILLRLFSYQMFMSAMSRINLKISVYQIVCERVMPLRNIYYIENCIVSHSKCSHVYRIFIKLISKVT